MSARTWGSVLPSSPSAERSLENADRALAVRALAALRVLLLPIALVADRLVTHRTVGTRAFDVILAAAATPVARRQSPAREALVGVVASDLTFVAALALASGVAFTELGAVSLALPIGAALLLTPRGIALVSVLTATVYVVTAFAHPATHAQPGRRHRGRSHVRRVDRHRGSRAVDAARTPPSPDP